MDVWTVPYQYVKSKEWHVKVGGDTENLILISSLFLLQLCRMYVLDYPSLGRSAITEL